MADWYIGQKVVCVSTADRRREPLRGETFPEERAVYTIRGFWDDAGELSITLEEIVNREHVELSRLNYPLPSPVETHFRIEWFRPLVNQSSDISVFTNLLIPLDEREAILA